MPEILRKIHSDKEIKFRADLEPVPGKLLNSGGP